jgi:hypothetical protein
MSDKELWDQTLNALENGDFSRLEDLLGGPVAFDRQIVNWFDDGRFGDEPEMLAEALSCACMLGRTETARHLLEHGVDPYAGMKTWLAGPHYAVSSGRLETVRMLIEKKVPLEIQNKYGGTLLGQALWSAVNEHKPTHSEIIELLLAAGARIEPGSLEWWEAQSVPSEETKRRVADALRGRDIDGK